jgi:hypothetical protein
MVIGFHADAWPNISFYTINPASAGFLHILYNAFEKSLDIVIVIF